MKKFLLLLITLLINLFTPVVADVMPYYVNNVNTETIGVYQAPKDLKVYSAPNVNSTVLLEAKWDYKNFVCAQSSVSNLFLDFIQSKELAFLPVVDETEGWVQVIYNRSDSLKGWIPNDDPFRLLMWKNFYNLYGRKYGFYIFKDVPETVFNLYSGTSETSQIVHRLKMPKVIKMTAIKGNWVLVSVFDLDRTPKTGFLQWRNTNGEIYAFPAIK